MRNKKAIDFGYSSWDVTCANLPLSDPDDLYSDDFEIPFDEDYSDAWLIDINPVFVIQSKDKEYISLKLLSLKENSYSKNIYEYFQAGDFCFVIVKEDNVNIKTQKFFSVTIEDSENPEFYESTINLSEDVRFKKLKFSYKFQDLSAEKLSFDELVELVSRCVKLSQMSIMR